MMGVHGLSIVYADDSGTNGSDSIGIFDTAGSDHPDRSNTGRDFLSHQVAPGATLKAVLPFYYQATYSAKAGHDVVVPRQHKPIKFVADTVIAPSQHCTTGRQAPIMVKLTCTK